MKRLVIATLAGALPVLAPAHVALVSGTVTPGAEYAGAFKVGHGCSGSATVALKVEIPKGVVAAGNPCRVIKSVNEYWESTKDRLVTPPVNAELSPDVDPRLAPVSSGVVCPTAATTQHEATDDPVREANGQISAKLIHEIRAPLGEILGLVHQALDTDLPPQSRRDLNTVISTAAALLKRLDLIQVSSGGDTFPNFKLGPSDEVDRIPLPVSSHLNTAFAALIVGGLEHEVVESLPARDSIRPPFPEADPLADATPIHAETAEMFCESAPLLQRKLCEAAAAGNLDLVQFTASSLKGSIAVLRGVRGAAECHRKVQEIEEFAALELLEHVQSLTPLLEPHFGLLLIFLVVVEAVRAGEPGISPPGPLCSA